MQVTQPENARQTESGKRMVISRVIHAPREWVWTAWTEPEHAKAWWGPQGFTAPVMQVDFREGGKYLFDMRSPDGQDFWSTGTYLEIDAPNRLVMTDSFADEEGHVVNASHYGMSADFPETSEVTVTFEAEGSDTRLTLTYDDVSAIADEDLRNMKAGWEETLDKLAHYVETPSEGHGQPKGGFRSALLKDMPCEELDDSGRPPRCEF